MVKCIRLLAFLSVLLLSQNAWAHMFWVNAYKSETHFPHHVITSLGYGHSLPMDDLLLSGKETIKIGKYFVAAPDGKRFDLHADEGGYQAPASLTEGLSAQPGDMNVNKIILGDTASEGTYQVAAAPETTCFTFYVNKKGKRKIVLKYMDEIQDLEKALVSMRCSFSGKTYFTVGQWTKPEPLGFDLEILPENDLSNVHVGDLITFKVLLNGRPLSSSFNGLELLNAQSPSFGGPDGFFLSCKLFNGKGKFRIPAAGQWVVSAYTKKDVEKNPKLAEFKGKTQMLYYSSSITFSVKP